MSAPRTDAIDIRRLEDRVTELLVEYRIPSASIGILHKGRTTGLVVGLKEVSTGEPATTDTIYQLGSMSKTWTALAFMQLLDEGKVALDEPVRNYIPTFRVADPEATARVTPRHLLNHTNGIEEVFGQPGEGDDVYKRMVEGIADAPQVFPLGHTHGYSAALGYAILARIMEVVDGRGWDEIMRRRLIEPLGLSSTSTRREDVDPERTAAGYLVRSLEEPPIRSPMPYLPRAYGPGGNLSSTVGDVLTTARLFLDGGRAPNGRRILSARSLAEMTSSRVSIPDPYMFGPWWALGLIVCDWQGQTAFASDGSTIGQNARLRILPESDLAIAMLTNGGPSESFHRRVFNEILSGIGTMRVPDVPVPDPTLELDLGRYEGAYERPGVRYEVTARGGGLELTFVRDPWQARVVGQPERTAYELLPVSETHFLAQPNGPLEDPQTVALYEFRDGHARYMHTNCRVFPRVN